MTSDRSCTSLTEHPPDAGCHRHRHHPAGCRPVDQTVRRSETGGTGWLRLLFGGLIFIAIARPRLADYRPADLRIALVLGLMTER